MTFSIVARDRSTGDIGVAAQSKFLAVGSAVPYARGGVGAVATQALGNVSYGPRGLDLLDAGATAVQALDVLVGNDELPERRQAAVVDSHGGAAAHTGSGCGPYAGHVLGEGFACLGNMLRSRDVLDAMAGVMSGDAHPDFAARLVAALLAGIDAGGDARGQQSAVLFVARPQGGYGGLNDRLVDLRVDDHVAPIEELQRLLGLHQLYFGKPAEADLLPLAPLVDEIASRLERNGYPPQGTDEDVVWDALERWAGRENLEERMVRRGVVDRTVLEWLRTKDDAGTG